MLPKVFDRTVFVKFKISNNFEQNIDETNLKQPKIHTVGNGFKNLKKIFRLANWIFILCDFHLLSERQSPTK
jgi:hypothetical protein